MEISELTLSLLYLAVPGIVCAFVFGQLSGIKVEDTFTRVTAIFVLSISAYLLAGAIEPLLTWQPRWYSGEYTQLALTTSRQASLREILFGVLASVLLAYGLSYGNRFKWISKCGQRLGATKRHGDEDVWHFFHNLPDRSKNGGWVFVRDYKANLAYHCYVSAYSDTGADRELVMSDVTVFKSDTADYLYRCEHIYLCRHSDELAIEVPITGAEEYKEYQWKDPDKDF